MAEVLTADIITNIRGLIKDLALDDGRDVFEYDDDSAFSLGKSRVSSSFIKVYQNNVLLSEDDWSYNADTNKVTITFISSGYVLTKGNTILITYDYYAKYSDTEIKGYIKSNLLRFTKARYKKLFYMNSSDEVVTLNGINPDTEEGNIIALITAVDIDPDNINIKIDGNFAVTASETKSKSEQIQDIFSDWLKCYGTLDFLESE